MKESENFQDSNLPEGLAQPALRALHDAGIYRIEQLTEISEAEIKQLHGIGPNALNRLRSALTEQGLSFATANTKQHNQRKA